SATYVLCMCIFTPSVANYKISQGHTLIVPKAFKVGIRSTVILNLYGYTSATVSAYVTDPGRRSIFAQVPARTLTASQRNSPIQFQFQITEQDIVSKNIGRKVEVVISCVRATFTFTKRVQVLIDRNSGYLFVQTDRPIYRPNERVEIRTYPLQQDMSPEKNAMVQVIVKTPDGIGVNKVERQLPASGFIDTTFHVAEHPMFGTWFVQAKYVSKAFTTTAEATFAVRKYVVPTFNVQLELERNYILISDSHITGKIMANYSYGLPVSGNYFLSMKLKRSQNGEPQEFYKMPGNGTLKNILNPGETIADLAEMGATFCVEATVNSRADSIMESDVTADLQFLKSPFIIDTSITSKYYIPPVAYTLQLVVYYNILYPKQDIRIRISVLTLIQLIHPKSLCIGIHNLSSTSLYQQHVTTPSVTVASSTYTTTTNSNDPDISNEQQARVNLTIQPYRSPSSSYLQILASRHTVTVRRMFQLTFTFGSSRPTDIRYYVSVYQVVARGGIVLSSVVRLTPLNRQKTINVWPTQAMVPFARVVAYYFKDNEVVSGSLWFDVVDQCKRELSIEVAPLVTPGATFPIRITGAPHALVSVSGVDKAAYYLYNGSRLTRDVMFKRMESHDQGCVRNGGEDWNHVFMGAGLSLYTSEQNPTIVDSLNCDRNSRNKRNVELEDSVLLTSLNRKLQQCRRDGKRDAFVNETCEMRTARCGINYGDQYPGCSFVYLCSGNEGEAEASVAQKRASFQGDSSPFAVEVEQPEGTILSLTILFSLFLILSFCSRPNGHITSYKTARDSITTFVVGAVGMQDSPDGFCIAPTKEMKVFKDVFVQINLPYSIRKLEQAQLKITIFNYNAQNNYTLRLHAKTDDTFCTTFKSGTWAQLGTFNIEAGGFASAPLTVIPLLIPLTGRSPIQLKVVNDQTNVVQDSIRSIYCGTDFIFQPLTFNSKLNSSKDLCRPAGEMKDTYNSYPIDLSTGNQSIEIGLNFPEQINLESRKCWIYAYASYMGPSIETNYNVTHILCRQPYGCGEQNMLVTGPNVYAHMFLVTTGKMAPVTQIQAYITIKPSFNQQMRYRSDLVGKRAWSVFSHYRPSTWLNAYVDRVFIQAQVYYTEMDLTPVCRSLQWLVGEQHQEGYFLERSSVIHREMHGAVGGRYSLTAYVLVTLIEAQRINCSGVNQQIQQSRDKAINYLRNNRNHPAFQRPYGLSILTYAMALHDQSSAFTIELNQRLLGFQQLDDNSYVHWQAHSHSDIQGTDTHDYWYVRRPQAIDVETSAYALLAQVQQSDLDTTRSIALWLISQRNEAGAFRSTQDTVVGLQALAEY
uniref:NTR domain-containing protein n=1 Tax=Ciona intestinalis TaxID=7719 RepID=F6U649_CIOIN